MVNFMKILIFLRIPTLLFSVYSVNEDGGCKKYNKSIIKHRFVVSFCVPWKMVWYDIRGVNDD